MVTLICLMLKGNGCIEFKRFTNISTLYLLGAVSLVS